MKGERRGCSIPFALSVEYKGVCLPLKGEAEGKGLENLHNFCFQNRVGSNA